MTCDDVGVERLATLDNLDLLLWELFFDALRHRLGLGARHVGAEVDCEDLIALGLHARHPQFTPNNGLFPGNPDW